LKRLIKILIYANVLLASQQYCHAQNAVIDSLSALINKEKAEATPELFNALSEAYYAENIAISSYYAELALQQAKAYHNFKSMIDAYINLGDCFAYSALNQSAYNMYDRADIINIKYKLKYKTIEIANEKGLAMCELNQCEEGLELMKNATRVVDSYEEKKQYLRIYSNIGLVHSMLSQWDSAMVYHQKALQYNNANTLNETSYILVNLGDVYLQKNKKDSAFYYYKQALQAPDISNDIETKTNATLSIAKLYMKQNETENALKYTQNAYDNAINQAYYYGSNEADSLLYALYNNQKNYPLAMLHQQRYYTTHDSLQKADLVIKNRMLAFENPAQKTQLIEHEVPQTWNLYLLLGSVFLNIFLIIYIIRFSK
jgi:uncharacterized protein with PIN domain